MSIQPRTLHPCTLAGSVKAIPAKAEAHRLLIAAAMADSASCLTGLVPHLLSEDIQATISALQTIGVAFATHSDGLHVSPLSSPISTATVDCHESGSTLRFLLPVLASRLNAAGQVHITGRGRLPQRPLSDLLLAMEQHGTHASHPTLPLTIHGKLTPGTFILPGHISSQYITGLMLALPSLHDNSFIKLSTPLESASYISLTQKMLQAFGVNIETSSKGWHIPGNQTFHATAPVHVGGDWSNAALWLVAGALSHPVTVSALDTGSAQGDRAILSLLQQAGAKVSQRHGDITVAPGSLTPLTVDMTDIPDLLPVLAILAAATRGTSHFTHAARLRLKESDRLAAVEHLINTLGGHATTDEDALHVTGIGTLSGGSISVCHDHRLVMAAVLATTISQGDITLDDPQAVNKSYPSLWEDFHRLGGN